MVTVGQLMKADLITVDTETLAVEAAKLMKACNAESLLVSNREHIVGIVTESDIVKKVVGTDRSPYITSVQEIMSSPVIGIEERRPLTEAADLMNKHHSCSLGVTRDGALVGILSVRDLLHPVSIDEF